jgi:hypothetical protein
MTRTLHIGLWGGPGSGKSTGAAWLFSNLKMLGVNAELVTEFAKDIVWENTKLYKDEPDMQFLVSAEQFRRLTRTNGQVDVVVTDSPLPLGCFYTHGGVLDCTEFKELLWRLHSKFDNMSFFVERSKQYQPIGRYQTEPEADALCKLIKEELDNRGVRYSPITGSQEGYDEALGQVLAELSKRGAPK